ncbi:MAG: KTSC domain-containing protein [Candidatus Schekmanbacteria bacterium]|nr:KTSC domain-containing protein [Candidatus Schekmanbacteria bacterium]
MNRTPVSSSNLASVGYDPVNFILEIEFHNGGIYQYFNVPESEFNGLMGAESHGKYFDGYIKKGGYSFKKIR